LSPYALNLTNKVEFRDGKAIYNRNRRLRRIFIRSGGGEKLTAEISAAYWREIAHHCFTLQRFKILIVKDFKKTVSPPEMVQMAKYLGYLLPTFKVAFIDLYNHQDINELGKKVARNKEVKIQIFDNFQEAVQWLLVN
jgi:hypothetical protein